MKKIKINLTNHDYAARFDVDDETGDEYRELAAEYLRKQGYIVETTATGQDNIINIDKKYEKNIREVSNDIDRAYTNLVYWHSIIMNTVSNDIDRAYTHAVNEAEEVNNE